MKNFQENIDKLVSKILNEEIESRVKHISETKGQWEEIEMDEELSGNQSKIDVAKPKGKITAADFKKLRKDRNEEKDMVVIDVLGGKTKNIKKDRTEQPDVVVDDILGGKIKYEETDEEVEEGNAFTGALAKAKESGKDSFNVDGKTYQVKESQDKWIQDTGMKKGALHKALGIPEGEKIPKSKLNSIKKDLMTKAKGDKKLSTADSKLLKQVNMALTLGGLKEDKNTLSLTENELIDMIENIVKEQIVKDSAEKNNFGVTKPQGLKKTEKAQGESKKENDDYASEVVKKMKDYMKDMFMGGGSYDENPDDFPQSNYQMDKDSKIMKYDPSEAVDEYIEAFAYPGMTNLVYDEIKPDDEMIEKQIKGDSKNGNAITGKDGNALGNVSKRSEKTGDRFKKNFDDNLYGAEQMNVSYKRQTQPVDVAGEKKEGGNLSSKKTSTQKAQKIMNQLESVESKTTKIIKEDLEKMRNLISYNRKTQ
jgi:hypothetical protein